MTLNTMIPVANNPVAQVDMTTPFAQLSDAQKQARIEVYRQRDAQLGLSEGLFIINKLIRIKARYKRDANGRLLISADNRYIVDHYEAHFSMMSLNKNRQLCYGYRYLKPESAVGKYGHFLADTFANDARRASVKFKMFNNSLSIYSITMREGKNPKPITPLSDAQFLALFDMESDLQPRRVKVPAK